MKLCHEVESCLVPPAQVMEARMKLANINPTVHAGSSFNVLPSKKWVTRSKEDKKGVYDVYK